MAHICHMSVYVYILLNYVRGEAHDPDPDNLALTLEGMAIALKADLKAIAPNPHNLKRMTYCWHM